MQHYFWKIKNVAIIVVVIIALAQVIKGFSALAYTTD